MITYVVSHFIRARTVYIQRNVGKTRRIECAFGLRRAQLTSRWHPGGKFPPQFSGPFSFSLSTFSSTNQKSNPILKDNSEEDQKLRGNMKRNIAGCERLSTTKSAWQRTLQNLESKFWEAQTTQSDTNIWR